MPDVFAEMANEPQAAVTNPTRPASNAGTKWSDWLGKPENRALLAQAGLALMQPVSPGQSFGGHVAGAIGQGFEARDRNLKTGQETANKARELDLEERRVQTGEVTAGIKAVKGAKTSQQNARWQAALGAYINEQVKNLPFSGDGSKTPAMLLEEMQASGELERLYQIFLQYGQLPSGTAASSVVPGPSPNLRATTTPGAEDPNIVAARQAIAQGAPRDAVISRLTAAGITPPPDL